MAYKRVYDHDNTELRAESLERLHTLFPKGSTVHTVLTRVSQSGMGRTFKVIVAYSDGDVGSVHYDIARVLGRKVADDGLGGIYMPGCGMDMGFALAYELSQALHGDGYALSHRHV